MSGFMNIIDTIGSDPRAWIVLALFAARALWSAVALIKCPVASGRIDAAAMRPDQNHSMKFLVTMLVGIALAVAGLLRLANGAQHPPIALFLLLLGVYLFTTAPVRRQVSLSEARVSRVIGGPEQSLAVDDLRSTHIRLVSIEFAIVGLLLVGMLAL